MDSEELDGVQQAMSLIDDAAAILAEHGLSLQYWDPETDEHDSSMFIEVWSGPVLVGRFQFDKLRTLKFFTSHDDADALGRFSEQAREQQA